MRAADPHTKKPRCGGAKSGHVGRQKTGGNFGPHRDTTTETVAHRPKQTVTQIGCKPTRHQFPFQPALTEPNPATTQQADAAHPQDGARRHSEHSLEGSYKNTRWHQSVVPVPQGVGFSRQASLPIVVASTL